MGVGLPRGMIGRQKELAVGARLFRDVLVGRGGVAVVEGEGGIGKSRLLQAWVDAPGPSPNVVSGVCDELERDRPFGVMSRTLGLEPCGPTFVAADAIVDLVDERSAQRPLAVLVEDVQWADPATLLVLHRLVTRAAQPVSPMLRDRTSSCE